MRTLRLWIGAVIFYHCLMSYATIPSQEDVQLSKHDTAILEKVASRYELYFFIRSDCGYCHNLAPQLKAFATQYHLKIIPITLDGKGLPTYPQPKLNDGIAEAWEVIGVPAIYAVNPIRHDVYGIAYGMEEIQIIAERLVQLGKDSG